MTLILGLSIHSVNNVANKNPHYKSILGAREVEAIQFRHMKSGCSELEYKISKLDHL